jgi:twitching motility protein PilT
MQIDEFLRTATKKGASDLHLVVGQRPIIRVNGVLLPIEKTNTITPGEMQDSIFSIINEEQRQKLLAEKELDVSYEIKNLARFRVNLHFEKKFLGLVARVIPAVIPTMEELQMPQTVYDLLKLNSGLILITGPTGCGKSTSLAAMIEYINNNRNCHIVTLEDPIEFIFAPKKSLIIQRQLNTDMLSFSSALTHVLRQDPNVIVVGEMRDLETISATVTLAETGHLVLATLHTHTADQTIDRIIDIFPSHQQTQIRLQLSLTLAGIISQKLIPTIRGGRLATREVLIKNAAVANLIRENKVAQIKTVLQTSAQEGMFTMDQDLTRLYHDGVINREVALSHMMNVKMLGK